MDRPKTLRESLQATLDRRKAKSSYRQLTVLPPESVDFSSNDFLSLSRSAIFRSHFLDSLNSTPPNLPFASGGSRLLDGNSLYAEDLENCIARFHDAPSGLLFNSGYDANVGVMSCIPQPSDVIVYDELIHASLHEGMRLSRAGKCLMFSHSSPNSLRQVLQSLDPEVRNGRFNVFIVLESVYSMDGDVAPVKEIIHIMEDVLSQGNGHLIIDEAHATGVIGPHGAGVVQHLGLQEKVFIRIHTFGKALASHGAVVLCSPLTREYLINYARSLIYTTALAYPSLVSIRTAYELLQKPEIDRLRSNLQDLIQHSRTGFEQPSLSHPTIIQIDHYPESPIFSLRTSKPRALASICQSKGFIVRAIMPPTVPNGKERVRMCLHAGNTFEEIDALLDIIAVWIRQQQGVAKL